MPDEAVIYCRVSTKEQVKNLSLSTQEKACRDYCALHDLGVAHVFVDRGESAKTIDRPEFRAMLEFCRVNRGRVRAVVVYAVNRFARNTTDHVTVRTLLARSGVSIRSATENIDDSPQGKLIEGVTAVIAEYENNVKAERTKVGMAEALRKGRWTFQPPLGYLRQGSKQDSTLVADPTRAPLVVQAFQLIRSGTCSKKHALEVVTAAGLRTLTGRRLGQQAFDRLLRNTIYAGRLRVERWRLDERSAFPSLVSQDVFDDFQAILDGRRVVGKTHQRRHPDFPLRHFARCADCGRPLTASWSRNRSGARFGYYRCPNPACKGTNERRESFHDAFARFIARLQPLPKHARLFRAVVMDAWRERQRHAVGHARQLERRQDELRERRARYVDAVAMDKVTKDEARDVLDAIAAELAEVRFALSEAHEDELDVEAVLGYAEATLTNAAQLWLDAEPEHKVTLQRALFPAGVTFGAAGFGTSATCLMFGELQPSHATNLQVASPTGFEPVSPP